LIDWWADTRISEGHLWQPEIERALAAATVAVLLISQDYLDSNFIVHTEVPPLVDRALSDGLILLPVFLSPCMVDQISIPLPNGRQIRLNEFQGFGSPRRTLREMELGRQEREWTRVAERLVELTAQAESREGEASATIDYRSRTIVREGRTLSRIAGFLHRSPVTALALFGAAAVVIPSGLAALGFLAMRARESLVQAEALRYPVSELFATGADVLRSLLVHSVFVFFSDFPTLRNSAIGLLLLVVLLVLLPRLRRYSGAARVTVLVSSAALLTLGGIVCTIGALANPLKPNSCQGTFGLGNRVAFEACSWLENPKQANDLHRESLEGLVVWLLVACLTAAWSGRRDSSDGHPSGRAVRGLVGFHLLLAIFLVQPLPQAYASARWGLQYPRVRILDKPECDQSLARAITNKDCCAFDVSDVSTEKYLVLRGFPDRCPEAGRRVSRDWGLACVSKLERPPEVIVHACR
jgi:hypothetical protein